MTTAKLTTPVIESVNPATGEVLARFPLFSRKQVVQALDDARRAYGSWRELSFAERADLLRRTAAYLRTQKTHLAGLITAEMGKPIRQSEAEVEKCAWACEFFADNAANFLEAQPHPSNAAESYVAFDPLGPILAIMPWNFPLYQVFRFAAPALMAGNTVVVKHASNVPQCALAVEEAFQAIGLPGGVFRTLLIAGPAATRLIADRRIAAVTITGSNSTGSIVAAAAGAAIKKTVMELGGSDPFIVLDDADLDAATQAAIRSRFQNSGQSCIAAKRFIVVEAVAAKFLQLFRTGVSALKVGDPAEETTDVGPLARRDLVDALDRQVKESIALGAQLELGGRRLEAPGFFYMPTILSGVTPAMPVFHEETFGPVAAVIEVRDVEQAIAMANDSKYGLGADLWTKDIGRAMRLASRIEAGSVFINGVVASDPRLPFGGVKNSGYGRELSEFGIREFTNIKTVWIGASEQRPTGKAPSE